LNIISGVHGHIHEYRLHPRFSRVEAKIKLKERILRISGLNITTKAIYWNSSRPG